MQLTHTLVAYLGAPILGACGGDCPGLPLDVVPFTSEPVSGTQITCVGDAVVLSGPCRRPDEGIVLQTPTSADCDAVRIVLGDRPLAGDMFVVWLLGDAEVTEARLEQVYNCDVENCGEFEPLTLTSGFVAPDEYSRDGRNTGIFELQFEGGTISGTYDVSPPPS